MSRTETEIVRRAIPASHPLQESNQLRIIQFAQSLGKNLVSFGRHINTHAQGHCAKIKTEQPSSYHSPKRHRHGSFDVGFKSNVLMQNGITICQKHLFMFPIQVGFKARLVIVKKGASQQGLAACFSSSWPQRLQKLIKFIEIQSSIFKPGGEASGYSSNVIEHGTIAGKNLAPASSQRLLQRQA